MFTMATVPTSPSLPELGSLDSILDVFKSNHPAGMVEAHIMSLQPSAVQEIVKIFGSPPRNTCSLQVLRALWCCSALRPSILHVFSSASFKIGGFEERLLDEVELLLAADARDGTKSPQTRVQTISMCATAVCMQAKDQESHRVGPLLVFCARAAAQVRTKRGRSVERRILKYILFCLKNPRNLRLKLLVAILDSEMKIDMADEMSFLHALDLFVARHCEDHELPAIFRATVTSLGRARTDRQISIMGLIALNILRKTTLGSLSNVLDILGTMIMDSEVVGRRLVDAISSLVRCENNDGEFLCERTRLGPSHISVMYFLTSTSSQNIGELVNELLQRIISDAEVTFDTSHLASSSSSATGSQLFRAFALLNNTKIPAVFANGETIATVFEGQVWSQRVGSQTWGTRMLFEAFVLIPRSRGKILNAIFTALTNVDTPDAVIHAFCGLLENICDSRKSALLLRDFGVQVQNLLNCVDYIPLRVDCKVVAALSRLSMTIPCLTNQMLLFLRKATGSRLLKLQRVACAGLLAVIEHSAVSDDTRLEACTTLGNIIEWSDSPVRAHLILLLISFLDRNPDLSGHIRSLSELVVRPLTMIVEKLFFRRQDPLAGVCGERKGSRCIVDPSLEDPTVKCLARDDLRLLLRLCDKLRSHDESIETFLFSLTEYMGDVKHVTHDACLVRDSQPLISTRVAQLCTLYEAMFCIDASRFSPSHVRVYAICLLIQDRETSKARYGSSSSQGIVTIPRSNSDVEMFASISALEAVSSELTGLYDTRNEYEMSIMDSVEALRVLSCIDGKDVLREVVQCEVLRLILIKMRGRVPETGIDSSEKNEFVQLLECIKHCFVATCPWREVNCCRRHEAKEAPHKAVEVVISADDTSRLPDRPSSSVQSACQCAEAEQRTSDFLSTIDLPAADIDNGVGPLQISKLAESLPSSIRQFSLAILVELLSNCQIENAWSVLHAFMREALHPQKTSMNHAGLGSNQENEKQAEGGKKIRFSPGRNAVPAESVEHSETAVALARVFCLEFEHSLSTALTMSYIDLFSCLLKAVEENRTVGGRVREVIGTTIKGIFRDYSIRQSRVLRGMMTLLLKSFEEKSGLEFCTSVIRWLGSDASLFRSGTMTRTGEISGRIGVTDFDIDILEEAIVSDTQRDDDSHSNAPRRQERGLENSCPRSSTLCLEENVHARDGTAQDSEIPQIDLIKTLCLNEAEENTVWSISCVLRYFGDHVRRFLEMHRRSSKDGFLEGEGYMDVLTGIVNAIAELFRTPFVETSAPRKSRMLLPIWKRLGDLMQDLLEIVEFQLRLIMADFRQSQGLMKSSRLVSVSKHILELLLRDEKAKFVTNAPQLVDQRSRTIFLQEKLDTTATAFLLCTAYRTSKPLEDLRVLLQARIRQIGTLTIAGNGYEDTHGGFHARARFQSRPRKRQCVRSRNRYVDGWLREENGFDNFVDLEDFIVPVDANY